MVYRDTEDSSDGELVAIAFVCPVGVSKAVREGSHGVKLTGVLQSSPDGRARYVSERHLEIAEGEFLVKSSGTMTLTVSGIVVRPSPGSLTLVSRHGETTSTRRRAAARA